MSQIDRQEYEAVKGQLHKLTQDFKRFDKHINTLTDDLDKAVDSIETNHREFVHKVSLALGGISRRIKDIEDVSMKVLKEEVKELKADISTVCSQQKKNGNELRKILGAIGALSAVVESHK